MRPYVRQPAENPLWIGVQLLCGALIILLPGTTIASEAISGTQPLLLASDADLSKVTPPDSHLLVSPETMEEFLVALDRTIPDWPLVYGMGHYDPLFDDRLFQLNRERDEQRKGKPALNRRITFCWSGRLSRYDSARGGFPVAIGPAFTRTAWGIVRFKPEELPANLTATAPADLRQRLENRIQNGQIIDLQVAMTGHLIAEESVIYDFSHEEEGQGLIMPVVQVEQVNYILVGER